MNSITIGQRHRRDLGDLDALAASINEIGLLHPIVVTPTGELIAGQRRLLAWGKTRFADTAIPRTVVDLDQIARGEYAENFFRKSFTPSELADIADALEPIERDRAKERQREHGNTAPGRKHCGEIPQSVASRALDHVGQATGRDRKTIAKAREVRDAAKAEPEKFGKLKEDMDRTGRVDGPFKRLYSARQSEAIRAEPPPLPGNGPYRVIVADPPWPYELRQADPSHRGILPYPSMSVAEICDLGVGAIAHADCLLWLWTTNSHMREAFGVLDAWGFTHKTILTWVKDRMGMGDWLRGQTEHCLMAVRGKPIVQLTNQTTVLHGPMREHSRKPDQFYDFVEALCPAPRYACLFSRHQRERWDMHGDESGEAAP